MLLALDVLIEDVRPIVEAMEDASVVADFAVNPDLLGGFRLQVGSRVFDGSLAGELGRLSREIEIEQG